MSHSLLEHCFRMKMVVFNDPHLSFRPPASRKANYADCILAKLQEIVDFANETNADVLACTGDWVISKKPESTPYWLAAKLQDVLSDFAGDRITAIGNHDVEAGVQQFDHSPVFMVCRAAQIDYHINSGVVWTNYAAGVEIVVVNYDQGTVEGIWKASQAFNKGTKCRVMIVHAPIIHSSFSGNYPDQFVATAVQANALVGCCDFLFYGDIHDYHGVYGLRAFDQTTAREVRTTFCNLGSIARNSAHELNRYRTVLVALFESQTGVITPVELEKVLPMDEVFRVEEIQRDKQDESDVNQFLDALDPRSLSFATLSPEIMKQRVMSEDSLNDREKAIALKAVDEAS